MVILTSWNFRVHLRYSSYSAHNLQEKKRGEPARQAWMIKLLRYTGEKAGVFSNGYTT